MKPIDASYASLFLGSLLIPFVCLSNGNEQFINDDNYSVISNSINEYRQNIRQLEVKSGPYHENLAAPLISLGIVLTENKEYSRSSKDWPRIR